MSLVEPLNRIMKNLKNILFRLFLITDLVLLFVLAYPGIRENTGSVASSEASFASNIVNTDSSRDISEDTYEQYSYGISEYSAASTLSTSTSSTASNASTSSALLSTATLLAASSTSSSIAYAMPVFEEDISTNYLVVSDSVLYATTKSNSFPVFSKDYLNSSRNAAEESSNRAGAVNAVPMENEFDLTHVATSTENPNLDSVSVNTATNASVSTNSLSSNTLDSNALDTNTLDSNSLSSNDIVPNETPLSPTGTDSMIGDSAAENVNAAVPTAQETIYTTTSSNGRTIEVINGVTYVDGILIVNKTYPLPSTYNPGDILPEVKTAFYSMKQAAAQQGLNIYISSGFRPYSRQVQLYQYYIARDGKSRADTFSARPGYSEHQSGLCIDLNSITDRFTSTPEASWVAQHAHEYGFIIRFPLGKEEITGYKYESWHLRYVGVAVATEIYQQGLCLEEYLGVTSCYQE